MQDGCTVFGINHFCLKQNEKNLFIFAIADWILLIYKDGTKYKSYCDGQSREAWVKLVCERSDKVSLFSAYSESCLLNSFCQLKFALSVSELQICSKKL